MDLNRQLQISIFISQVAFLAVCLWMVKLYDAQMRRIESNQHLLLSGVVLTAEAIQRHDHSVEKTSLEFMAWRAKVDSTLMEIEHGER